ncbi:hypothetical protein [Nonomuraea sp. NPDC050643]|uniref:hypothetical protein n=1 Tax=Nonomuraea sp. NPDC050643 TaxID=3155660 RepID=UPI00340AC0D5
MAHTALPSKAVPSWNFTSRRRSKVHVRPSSDGFQLSASRRPISVPPGLGETRVSYICSSVIHDRPSAA